jgi:hypothetical protein
VLNNILPKGTPRSAMTIIQLILILILLFGMQSRANKDPWCVNHAQSLNKDQLRCLKSLTQTLKVRQFLTDVISGKVESVSLNTDGVISEKRFLEFFKQPILVFDVSYAKSGGYDVHFIFKNFSKHEFFTWLTYNDDESYKVEIVVDSGPEKESAKIRKSLQKKEFDQFWISPPDHIVLSPNVGGEIR